MCVFLIVSLLFILFVHYYYSSSCRVFLSARDNLKIIFLSSLATSLITQRGFSFSLSSLKSYFITTTRSVLFFFLFFFFYGVARGELALNEYSKRKGTSIACRKYNWVLLSHKNSFLNSVGCDAFFFFLLFSCLNTYIHIYIWYISSALFSFSLRNSRRWSRSVYARIKLGVLLLSVFLVRVTPRDINPRMI